MLPALRMGTYTNVHVPRNGGSPELGETGRSDVGRYWRYLLDNYACISLGDRRAMALSPRAAARSTGQVQ